ncbi:MAG: type II secretion system protein GspN [Bradymonadaceae bacterium]
MDFELDTDSLLVRVLAPIVFGVVVFAIALVVTFPDTQLQQIAEVQLEKQLERNVGTPHNVDIGDVDPWWIGLQLQNVTISTPSASGPSASGNASSGAAAEKKAKKKKAASAGGATAGATGASAEFSISIPSVGVCFSPTSSLVSLGLSFGYFVGLEPGSVSGYVTQTTDARSLSVELDGLNLEPGDDVIERLTGVPTFGRLEGWAELTFAPARPVVTGGKVSLTGRKLTIGPKEELELQGIAMANYLKVPQTNLGSLDIALHVDNAGKGNPKVVVDTFKSKGRDVRTQLWGHLKLARRLAAARAQLKMRVKFPRQAFVSENQLGALLRTEQFQSGKRGDWYGFVLWGRLASVNFKGAATAAKGPGSDSGQKGGKKGK